MFTKCVSLKSEKKVVHDYNTFTCVLTDFTRKPTYTDGKEGRQKDRGRER